MQIVENDVIKWVKGGRKHTSQSKYDPDLRTWVQRESGTGIGTVVLGRGVWDERIENMARACCLLF